MSAIFIQAGHFAADVFTPSSDVAKGDLLIISFTSQLATAPTGVTDTQGNVWTKLAFVNPGGAPKPVAVFATIASASGAITITVHEGGSSSPNSIFVEYGFATTTLDQLDQVTGAGTTSAALSITGNAGDLDLCIGITATGNVLSVDNGFTIAQQFDGGAGGLVNMVAHLLSGAAPQPVNVATTAASNLNDSYILLSLASLAAIVLTPAAGALTPGSFNAGYSQAFTATGGNGGPFTFAVTAGALPGGLTLNPDGTLSGQPNTTGNFSFTITATDVKGLTGSAAYTLAISASATPSLSVLQANLRSIPPKYPSSCLKEGRKVAQYFLNPNNFAQVNVIPSLPNFTGYNIGEYDIVTGSGQSAQFTALQGLMVCAVNLTASQMLVIDTGDGVPILLQPLQVPSGSPNHTLPIFCRLPIYTAPGNIVKVYLVDFSGTYAPSANCEINVSLTNFIPDTATPNGYMASGGGPVG